VNRPIFGPPGAVVPADREVRAESGALGKPALPGRSNPARIGGGATRLQRAADCVIAPDV